MRWIRSSWSPKDRPLLVGSDKTGSASGSVVLAEIGLGVAADIGDDMLDRIADLIDRREIPDAMALPDRGRVVAARCGGQDRPSPRRRCGRLARGGLCRDGCGRPRTDGRDPRRLPQDAGCPTRDGCEHGLVAALKDLGTDTRGSTGTASRIRAVLVGVTQQSDGKAGLEIASDGVDAVRTALVSGGTPDGHIATLSEKLRPKPGSGRR